MNPGIRCARSRRSSRRTWRRCRSVRRRPTASCSSSSTGRRSLLPALKRPEAPIRLPLPARQALLAGETDVLVVGGGPAGLGAAIAAADAGARVVLAERYGFLGGNATAALVMPLMSFYTDKGKAKPSASTSLLPSDHGPG